MLFRSPPPKVNIGGVAAGSAPAFETKGLAVGALGKVELNIVKAEEPKKAAKLTVPQSDDTNYQYPPVKILREQVQPHIKCKDVSGDDRIAKVSVVGLGMRSHAGIAAQMFRTLAEEGINIQMISTSEIKISVVVEEKYIELAVRVLHNAFALDK